MKKTVLIISVLMLGMFATLQAQTVYVTANGEKYHKKDCQYAQTDNVKSMSLAAAKSKGYTACSVCFAPASDKGAATKAKADVKKEVSTEKTAVKKVETDSKAGAEKTKTAVKKETTTEKKTVKEAATKSKAAADKTKTDVKKETAKDKEAVKKESAKAKTAAEKAKEKKAREKAEAEPK